MKIVNKEFYRSKQDVTKTDDCVRITIAAKINELSNIEEFIKQINSTNSNSCHNCAIYRKHFIGYVFCPKCGKPITNTHRKLVQFKDY